MLKRLVRTAPALALVLAMAAAGSAFAAGAANSPATRQAQAKKHHAKPAKATKKKQKKATKKKATKQKVNASVKLSTAKVSKLGTVLVDSKGRTLYMFAPDKHKKVTCNSSCQSIWPPLTAPKSGVAKATGQVKQGKISSDKNPVNGKRIVTYNGWPLYYYVTDSKKGQANGQNLDINGGYWWVMQPNGHYKK